MELESEAFGMRLVGMICLGLFFLVSQSAESGVFSSIRNKVSPTRECKNLKTVKQLFEDVLDVKNGCRTRQSCSALAAADAPSKFCQKKRKLLCNPYCQSNMRKQVQKKGGEGASARKKWLKEIEPLYKRYFGHASGFVNRSVRGLCEGSECETGTPPTIRFFQGVSAQNKPRVFVLSVDGGGIKGIIPAYILERIETRVKDMLKADGHFEKARRFMLSDVFTLSAGTSTGGLIALYLNAYKPGTTRAYPTTGLIPLYQSLGQKVFHSGSWHRNLRGKAGVLTARHSAKPLEALLQEKLGNQTLAYAKNFLLITSTDAESLQTFLFTTRGALESLNGRVKNAQGEKVNLNYFLWQAGRATSAAPTFFKPFTLPVGSENSITLIDGGVGVNDPAVHAFYEMDKILENETNLSIDQVEVVLLSLSTGRDDFKLPKQKFSGPFGGGAIQALGPTLASLMTIPNVNYQEFVKHELPRRGGKVIRIEGTFKKFVPFNVATQKSLDFLMEKARETANHEQDKIEEMANLIFQSVVSARPRISGMRSYQSNPVPLPPRKAGKTRPRSTSSSPVLPPRKRAATVRSQASAKPPAVERGTKKYAFCAKDAVTACEALGVSYKYPALIKEINGDSVSLHAYRKPGTGGAFPTKPLVGIKNGNPHVGDIVCVTGTRPPKRGSFQKNLRATYVSANAFCEVR